MSEFSIISLHPESHRRTLRQYPIDGINTIGVYGNEPFSIRFRDSSGGKTQIKLSLDGTDIITGEVANLDPHSKMWLVNPFGSIELKAWPESNQGGAAFVFTSVENSVAAHTHGDLSAKGFISCAIFVEGYTPPERVSYSMTASKPVVYRGAGPAIGAGSYQEQKIDTAAGLIQPTFSRIIQIRYLWWDDLLAKLQAGGAQPQYPSGFHGEIKGVDLGDTPRIGAPQLVASGAYQRFY